MGPISNASSWVGHSGEVPVAIWILLYVAGSVGTAYAYGRLLGMPKCNSEVNPITPGMWVAGVAAIWPVGLPAILSVWAAMRGEQDRKADP